MSESACRHRHRRAAATGGAVTTAASASLPPLSAVGVRGPTPPPCTGALCQRLSRTVCSGEGAHVRLGKPLRAGSRPVTPTSQHWLCPPTLLWRDDAILLCIFSASVGWSQKCR
eukprot:NODE_22929_length_688_cov_2.228164.p3 GENE.NODE_22929_length_688_cov_2.228164~~NODE_22929_length_688_cov_2.228164.p3  ORF type:complete len:114 (+),score=11.84 NODE_22929_length_688_cov_2.228164:99-440(+)